MKVPGLSRTQIMATAGLARAMRLFLIAHGVDFPRDHELAIGEGHIDLDDRTLSIKFDFFKPIALISTEDDENFD